MREGLFMVGWNKWTWLAANSTRTGRRIRQRRSISQSLSKCVTRQGPFQLQPQQYNPLLSIAVAGDPCILTCPRCGLRTLSGPSESPQAMFVRLEKALGIRSESTLPPLQDTQDLALSSSQASENDDSISNDSFPTLIPLMGREIDQDMDEQLSHLRVKLYPSDEDSCGTLSKLYEAASIQEVLDIIEDLPEVNLKFSSQALVTLWDLQKLLFKLGPMFNPENDFSNKAEFIRSVKDHPTFLEKIVRPVVENHKELNDEPLCASIFCLKKMDFELSEFEPLIEECIRRKNSLSLTGLSRLSVSLRSENIYGNYVMASFMPLVLKYIQTMSTDMDIRLVSILIRNLSRILSTETQNTYVDRIENLINTQELESVTYSKIFLTLSDVKIDKYSLMRKVGTILASRVSEMELLELLLLQKFLISPLQEPYPLIEALLQRNLRLIEEEDSFPRLDLMSAVAPHLRNIQQRKMMSQAAKEYMSQSHFESAAHVLFGIIKCARTNDKELYDQYWNGVLTSLEKPADLKRILTFAKNYLNFTHSVVFSYRNLWLESVLKKNLYTYIDNYCKDKPGFLSPTDFAGIMAFLIAFDQHFVDVLYLSKLSDFASNLKVMDMYFLAKGVDSAMINVFYRKNPSSKNYNLVSQICNLLEEECGFRLMENAENITNNELITMCRMVTVTSKIKGDSPLFDLAMKRVLENGLSNSREVRELCGVLNNGNYYYPQAMELISEFLFKNLEYLSPETVERFLGLSYALGWEKEDLPFDKLARFIELHWEKLGLGVIQSSLALAFHRQLKPELINSIFNVKFLDQIDEDLSSSFGNSAYYPLKLRMTLMELNRAVCLDVPDARLPWFHDKFCQSIIASGKQKTGYLHQEVFKVLCDLLGGDNAVLSSVCSPKDYYYPIDFVLEFDEADRPIRRKKKRYSIFGGTKDRVLEVKRKVAILVSQKSGFTKNVRNLNGSSKLKQRHLEMLGYHVVKIDPYHWNSMYMSEHLAKQNFLESQIFR